MPSSRAVAAAQRSAGPSNGSAPAAVSSGVPSTAHFSGSTTSSAPAAAAARVRRSAVARLRSRSAVEVSWTAAARTVVSPFPRIDSSVNPRRSISSGHAGARERVARSGAGAPRRCPLPPERMPAWRGGRPLKRWTWVGAFGPELMLCAAVARIGPATAAWWAVWDRAAQRFEQRSLRRAGGLRGDAVARARAGRDGARGRRRARRSRSSRRTARSTSGRASAAACAVSGVVRGREVDAARARRRVGRLSRAAHGVAVVGGRRRAGVRRAGGVEPRRRRARLAGRARSARCGWTGAPRELPPQAFDGLAGVGGLRFSAEATRARRENLVLMSSDYEQPFGTFARRARRRQLREGYGVMERHAVAW